MSELKSRTKLNGFDGAQVLPKYEPPCMSSTSEESLLGEMAPIHGVSPAVQQDINEL